MGTAVAVVKMNRPVAYVDPKKLNKDAAKAYLSRISGPKSPFAGTQIRGNGQDGYFQIGYGEGAKQLDEVTLVLNVPQTLAAWQYWPEDEAPTYPFIAPIFTDAQLPSRDACGPEETKYNKLRKEDEDVWTEVMVAIMRSPKKSDLYHMITARSASRALSRFVMECADEPELEKGMLPVVTISYKKEKMKDGGSFQSMQFEIVEWVKATAADLPKALEEATPDEEPEEEQDEKPVAKAKGGKPTASAKPPRREEPVEEENEETEEETEEADDKPVVRSRNGKDTARAKTFEQSEEEEQDERPAKSKKSAKDDDGEVVKQGLRKRRAAL
jgi:hypothetical protein